MQLVKPKQISGEMESIMGYMTDNNFLIDINLIKSTYYV